MKLFYIFSLMSKLIDDFLTKMNHIEMKLPKIIAFYKIIIDFKRLIDLYL